MRKMAVFIGLFIILSGVAIFSMGCPPPIVRVRPPEPRVEVYGAPPHSQAVWIGGYWQHRRGEWIWIPGHWERRPRPRAVWVPGHWEARRGGWAWHKGRWR